MKYPITYWIIHMKRWWGMLISASLALFVVAMADHRLIVGMGVVTFCAIVYFCAIRIIVPECSAIMNNGKILEVCMGEERQMIWNDRIFGKRIVSMECEEIDEWEHKRGIVFPAQGNQVAVCTITITFNHIMHINAWQRFYDGLIMVQNGREMIIEGMIAGALECVRRPSLDISGKEETLCDYIIGPLTNDLNKAAKVYGLVANVECAIELTSKYVIPIVRDDDEEE